MRNNFATHVPKPALYSLFHVNVSYPEISILINLDDMDSVDVVCHTIGFQVKTTFFIQIMIIIRKLS